MNEEARGYLCEIIQRHGRGVIDNPEWIEGLLLAGLSNYPRELNIILAALHEDIPAAIFSAQAPLAPDLMEELSRRLEDCQMLKREAANWAVESWAEAVQLASPAGARRLPVTGGLARAAHSQILRSRMAIEVLARPRRRSDERFTTWGSTPGSVPLPEEYEFIFKKAGLNDSGLEKLACELANVGPIYGLDLSSGRYSGSALIEFLSQAYFNDLRVLNLSGTATTTDTVLAAIARLFPHLEELNPGSKCYITDEGLGQLRELPQLTHLNLAYCQKITNRGMAFLRALDHLEALDLGHVTAVGDDGLAHLQTLPKLGSLDLSGCFRITENGAALLGQYPALEELRLDWNNRLNDACLQGLRPLDGLLRLSLLKCTGLSDAGISALEDLSSLEELNLGWMERLTDDGLTGVGKLRNLRSLSLYQCTRITDTGIYRLKGLSGLRTLDLAGVEKLTGVGLDPLKALEQLEDLTLDGRNISGSALVELVRAMPELKRLHVWSGAHVTQEEAAQIRRPGMDVWIRGVR